MKEHLHTLREVLEALVLLAAMLFVVLQPHPADSGQDPVAGQPGNARATQHR